MQVEKSKTSVSRKIKYSDLKQGDTFRQSSEESNTCLYMKVDGGGYISFGAAFYWSNPNQDMPVIPVQATVTWSE